MLDYSRIFGSNFPNSAMELSNFQDIGSAPTEVQEIAKQYYIFMEAGNIASASALIESNWELVKPYYFGGANVLNKIEEELYNAEILALSQITTVVSDTEPIGQVVNATWYKPV